MKKVCFFCGHTMVKNGSRTEIRNGEARKLTELVCTNPSCGNIMILDEPY